MKIKNSADDIHAYLFRLIRERYIPSSTYRLQLNSKFTFKHAEKISGFLKRLGIDAVYTSPYFQATPGSMHGYDVTDPACLNAELGTDRDYDCWIATLKKNGLGHVLDVVPNHMGISSSHNRWWMDILENGPASIYAGFFDIDWTPEKRELHHKVLLPVLGDQYGKVLENQELNLLFRDGAFSLAYWDHRFPIAPDTYPLILAENGDLAQWIEKESDVYSEFLSIMTAFRNLPLRILSDGEKMKERDREKEIAKRRFAELTTKSKSVLDFIQERLKRINGQKGEAATFDALDQLLNQQSYRLSYWRVAAHEINYRRFFNINELAALRIEEEKVFLAHHQLLLKLLTEDKIQGVRIDHPDGLYDPPGYFRRLQKEYVMSRWKAEHPNVSSDSAFESAGKQVEQFLRKRGQEIEPPLFTVVEKILDRKEPLPADWLIDGTVGYGFLNALSGLFIDNRQEKDFQNIYRDFIGEEMDYPQLVYEKKKLFAAFYMTSELNTLGHRLNLLSEHNRCYRDFTLNDLVTALREIIACFPVYRTYITPEGNALSEQEEKFIRTAVEKAKGKHPALSATLFDFLRDLLLLSLPAAKAPEINEYYREFILRFQQLTGPITAKGVEDTAFYIYNRFISLNEVGGDPEHFGFSADDFHRMNKERQEKWPYSMVTHSTHDTKRSLDVRMRLNALSELPEEWHSYVTRWSRSNRKLKTLIGRRLEPGKNTEYFIYQTLAGVWPDGKKSALRSEASLKERLWAYVQKAVREAKLETNWLNPNAAYEDAVKNFLMGLLEPSRENYFLKSFLPFQKKISRLGKWNTLSALTLMMGTPGVVDFYQGTEFWDYSLVDPDNRRPVDFVSRDKALQTLEQKSRKSVADKGLRELWKNHESGEIKLYLLWKGLSCRKKYASLFLKGAYIPLKIRGARAGQVTAYLRKEKDHWAIVAAARLFRDLLQSDEERFKPKVWDDTFIHIPAEIAELRYRDIFTDRIITVKKMHRDYVLPVQDLFTAFGSALLLPEKL